VDSLPRLCGVRDRRDAAFVLTEVAGQVEPGPGDRRLVTGFLGVGVKALEDDGCVVGRLSGGQVQWSLLPGEAIGLFVYPSPLADKRLL
jgi:hypothetical protein